MEVMFEQSHLFSRKWTLCETKGLFQNRLLNIVLANCGHPLPLLIMEQIPTALLVDGQRQLRDCAQQVIDFTPQLLWYGRARLGGLHFAAWNT